LKYRRILVFGHSIVHGLWDEDRGGWVERLRQELYSEYIKNYKDHWDEAYSNVWNMGVTNEASEELRQRIESELKRRCDENPDRNLVMLQFGINSAQKFDGVHNVPPDKFEENLREIIQISRKYADKVILVGEGFVSEEIEEGVLEGDLSDRDVEKYERIKKSVGNELGTEFIGIRQKIDRSIWEEKLFDGVHPDKHGHELIFDEVLHELESMGLV
jgi:lysophospholipase L1-like esterase